ncbi:MAG: ACT domain-containing protein [Synergistaceae bacterium]|jgi:hypothetical protein|nr:ACT domain-containing protein [Synergistaceae bacterium]
MTVDQISVFVENKPGRLAEIAAILGDAGVDMRAMSIADTSDFGILRLIVDDPKRAQDLLNSAGCVVSVTPVLAVSIADKPGSLAKVLGVLSEADISVEYAYAFITRKQSGAYVIFRVEDNARALETLTKHGVKTAGASDLYEL